jgi:hypothetical protein
MRAKIINVSQALRDDYKTLSAKVLELMETEIVDTVEAFTLGRDLQRLLELQCECSCVGVSEEEIMEVILYVEKKLNERN